MQFIAVLSLVCARALADLFETSNNLTQDMHELRLLFCTWYKPFVAAQSPNVKGQVTSSAWHSFLTAYFRTRAVVL